MDRAWSYCASCPWLAHREVKTHGRHSPSSTSPSTPAVVPWQRVHHGGGVRLFLQFYLVVLVGCMSGWLCFDYLEYFLSVNKFSAVAMLFWPRLQLSQSEMLQDSNILKFKLQVQSLQVFVGRKL
nr:uncharacterized protein LOC127320526 [Lolium perenne]